jgi:hypothetical protein
VSAPAGSAARATRLSLLLSFAIGVALAATPGFVVRSAAVSLDESVYHVDADIALEFSDESKEALANGVPLTILIEMQVVRSRAWMWDETVADLRADYELEYHALSSQYVVRNLNLGTSQSFATLQSARAALGTVSGFPLVDAHLLSQEGSYVLRIRARLNIEALPAPLRPLAYLSSLWRLDSEWYEWPMQR